MAPFVKSLKPAVAVGLLCASLLASCSAREVTVPVEVKVPVPVLVRCDVTIPPRPEIPIAKLEPTSAPADTIRAYASSVALLKGLVIARETLLAGCAK